MRRAASSSEYVWLLSNFINTKLWGTIHVEAINAEMMHSQHANVLIKKRLERVEPLTLTSACQHLTKSRDGIQLNFNFNMNV